MSRKKLKKYKFQYLSNSGMDAEKVRVILSEETTSGRVHSKDGKSFENNLDKANCIWVTNLPCPESKI
jgi:hypothetical protein